MRSNPIQILIEVPFRLAVFVWKYPFVLIGILIGLYYWGADLRRPGTPHKLLLLLAIAATGMVAFFLYLGFAMRWSTDGPGLLLVWMGIAGFGVLAIATWIIWVVRMSKS